MVSLCVERRKEDFDDSARSCGYGLTHGDMVAWAAKIINGNVLRQSHAKIFPLLTPKARPPSWFDSNYMLDARNSTQARSSSDVSDRARAGQEIEALELISSRFK